MDFNSRASKAISEQNLAGQIQKIFGLNGELVVKLWDNFPIDNFDEPLWIEVDSKGVPLYIKSFKSQGISKAVIVFEDWESEDLASELIGKSIYFESSSDMDEYGDGLVGWTIFDSTTNKNGTITDYYQSDINPMLFVDFDGKECMIPLAEEYIVSFDEQTKKIEAQFPDGLLDL